MTHEKPATKTNLTRRILAPLAIVSIAASSVLVAPAAYANPFSDAIDRATRDFNDARESVEEEVDKHVDRARSDFDRTTSGIQDDVDREVDRVRKDVDRAARHLNSESKRAERDLKSFAEEGTSVIEDHSKRLNQTITGISTAGRSLFSGPTAMKYVAEGQSTDISREAKDALKNLEAGRDMDLTKMFQANSETFEALGAADEEEIITLAKDAALVLNAVNQGDYGTVVEKLEDHGVIDRRAAIQELKRQGIINTEAITANLDAGTVAEAETILAQLGLADTIGMLNDNGPSRDYGTEHGLTVIEDNMVTGRMQQLRVQTDSVDWGESGPAVNVLLPEGYEDNPDKEYPVMYLYHGGAGNFREFEKQGIEGMSKDMIIVMPDGGLGGWYTDAEAEEGNDWESFHTEELPEFIDQNYRTTGHNGAGGFSMGGYGAMKYTAENPDKYDSVTSFSGPTDLRDRGGIVTHWANASGVIDNGSVTGMYGGPWDEEKVSDANPIENTDAYRDKRVSIYSGNSDDITESSVRSGHNNFSKKLKAEGIDHQYTNFNGPHHVRNKDLRNEVQETEQYLRAQE